MIRISPLVAVLFAAVFASCDQTSSPDLLSPPVHEAAILDGRDAAFAGSGVFLLPPISDNQYTRTAPFDVNSDPRVEICELVLAGEPTVESVQGAVCGDLVAWFETDASFDGVTLVQVQPAPGGPEVTDSMYSVSWKTAEADADKAFRVSILLPDLVLDADNNISIVYGKAAEFDAMLYDNASTKLDPDQVVGSTAGQNFPVKFIVEEGASCDGLDCFAYKVTCEAAVYQTEHAGVSMPEDWAPECDATVPGPERSWWLFQERLPEGTQCLPNDLFNGVGIGACYVWQLAYKDETSVGSTLVPYTKSFDEPVIVQFCNDEIPEELQPLAGIFRFSTNPDTVALVEEVHENALTTFSCPYVEDGSTGSSGLSFTNTIIRPALRLIGLEPRPLHAGDGGVLSGSTTRMSDFQRALQLEIEASSDTALSGVLGSTEWIEVWLSTPPHHEPSDGPSAGVPGFEVQFRVISGDADLSSTVPGASPCVDDMNDPIEDCIRVPTSSNDLGTPTDEGGFAGVTVTIGGTAGTIQIKASVPEDPDVTLTFTVEAVDLLVTFLEPLDTGDFYGAPDEFFVPVVFICAEGLTPCDATTAEVAISGADIKLVTEKTGRKFYQTDWKPKDTGTAYGTYFVQVVVEGVTVGYSIPIVVTKGGKGERIDDVYYNGESSTLATKFTITRVSTP